MKMMKTKKKSIMIIREDDMAIFCEGNHLKVSSWKLTGPSGRKFRKPHLYPVGNWRILEPAARAWLYRRGMTLQEGECAICPSDLVLQQMLGE